VRTYDVASIRVLDAIIGIPAVHSHTSKILPYENEAITLLKHSNIVFLHTNIQGATAVVTIV